MTSLPLLLEDLPLVISAAFESGKASYAVLTIDNF
jgi:hypothetical protein